MRKLECTLFLLLFAFTCNSLLAQAPKHPSLSEYMMPRDAEIALAKSAAPANISNRHPHVMVFSPYYENSMLGGHEFGSPLPFVSDDAGTPFAVVLIPVDDRLAVKVGPK